MDLSQRLKNFEAIQLKGDREGIVEKAVELANVCQQMRKHDTAIACLNKVLPVEEAGQHAVVKTALGVAYWEKAQLQKALNYFKEALTLFEEAHDSSGQVAIFSMVGITFWRKCDWDKALEILKKGVARKNLNADPRFASLYGALDRGIVTLQNRVRMGRELQDPLKTLQPLFSICALYWVKGNEEQFRTCLDESVALAEQLGKTELLKAAKGIRLLGHPV